MAGLAIRSWCSEAIDCLLCRNQMALISAAFCQQGVVSMDIVFGHASHRKAALEDFPHTRSTQALNLTSGRDRFIHCLDDEASDASSNNLRD